MYPGDIVGTSVGPRIPPIAFVLAIIASCNSVAAAVYTETLFKVVRPKRSCFYLLLYIRFEQERLKVENIEEKLSCLVIRNIHMTDYADRPSPPHPIGSRKVPTLYFIIE